MSSICLYLDEDARGRRLLQALHARGVDVITVAEVGMLGCSDEEHLNWALMHNRVLYSFNVRDFCQLHTTLLERGQLHAGIILAPQQRYSVGEQMRGILKLIAVKSAEEMQNHVEFLSAWID